MDLKKLFPVLIILILLGTCSQVPLIKKDFDTNRPNLDSISILFPHVIYYEKNGEVKTMKPGHSLHVSKNVADIFQEIIDEGKYLPKTATFVIDTMLLNQWIPQNFLQSIAYYEMINDSIRVSQSEKSTFPITAELQQLVDKTGTSHLVFISGTAWGASDESKQFDALQAQIHAVLYDMAFSYDYQWYSLLLNIYVIDKESKEILWYRSNTAQNAKYDALKKSNIRSLCLRLLK